MREKIVYVKPAIDVVELTLEDGVCFAVGSGGSNPGEENLAKKSTFDFNESVFSDGEE